MKSEGLIKFALEWRKGPPPDDKEIGGRIEALFKELGVEPGK